MKEEDELSVTVWKRKEPAYGKLLDKDTCRREQQEALERKLEKVYLRYDRYLNL